ncbi:hypothetical protein [Craterilacuibacter sinensis]|uniref:Uncharacterized protein n=1 Tax=Craterilacuibacter sinensis TaxID=2686017 RepID=A0A845BR95_9NEIS|nr:hypothetical protein [Craterilacuibacter sinensis]MXR36746.1 hypothetical protein [Craterilacuibacter sinensis]
MKIQAIAASAKLQSHDPPHQHLPSFSQGKSRQADAGAIFDETLDSEQRRHADGEGEGEGSQRRQAARSRLFLLEQSVALLGERLLGAALPVLLHAGADLLWMAQELTCLVEDLAEPALSEADQHACLAVLVRLRSESAFIEARSARTLDAALRDQLDALALRLA